MVNGGPTHIEMSGNACRIRLRQSTAAAGHTAGAGTGIRSADCDKSYRSLQILFLPLQLLCVVWSLCTVAVVSGTQFLTFRCVLGQQWLDID